MITGDLTQLCQQPMALAAPRYADPTPVSAPMGEVTRRQQQAGGVYGFGASLDAPPPGTYKTYREMSGDPTLAMAEAVVMAPIVAGSWSYESDDDVDDDTVQEIQDAIDPMRRHIVRECLRALRYGWQPFEKVWTVEDGVIKLEKLKPLLPDITDILVDGHGGFLGLRQKGVPDLPVIKSFIFTYDGEAGNLYGRSRHENCRDIFLSGKKIGEKASIYHSKVAGVVGQLHYPLGESEDKNGTKRPNYEIAQQVAMGAASGQFVFFPNLYASDENVRNAADLAGKSQWVLSYMDPGGSNFAAGFIDERRYLDSLKMRGWLRPERSAIEGQFGTKAEAETHGDVGVIDGDLVHVDITEAVNKDIIDELLELNHGRQARGTVYACPAPLLDSKRDIAIQLLTALLANPATLEAAIATINWDAVYDSLGIPKATEIISLADYFGQNPPQPQDQPTDMPPGAPKDLPPEAAAALARIYGRRKNKAA